MPPRATAVPVLALAFALLPQTLWSASFCDLNSDGRVDVVDVQLGLNQALGFSSCTNADLSQDGQCDIVDVQTLVNAALGQECLVGSGIPVSPPPPDPEPWEREFTTLRVHYVEGTGGCTSGGTCGEIGNPETLAHALSHDQAGDLHILRGGTYTGNSTMSAHGTSTNPIIWKCFIDSDGNPENCNLDGSWDLTGDWNWVWAMNNEDATTLQTQSAFQLEARGTAFINSRIVRYPRGTGLDSFNFGPDMVIYGATLIHNGLDNRVSAPRHNAYTANNYAANGIKYVVQLVTLDVPPCELCPNSNSNNLFQINFSNNAGGNGTGYHIQDSVFQDGRINFSQHTGFTTGNPPLSRITFHQNWIDSLIGPTMWWRMGDQVPIQIKITDNLIRKARIDFRSHGYYGHDTSGCFATLDGQIAEFSGNSVYSPDGTTQYVSLPVTSYDAECDRGTIGAAKIRDADIWNNNTYARAGGGGTFTLHANGSGPTSHTLAQWRTATDAARQTAGGTAFDADSTESSTLSTTDQVECLNNFYEPGWGYCRAIDWDGNGSITIPGAEADKIVGNGKTYKVRNVRDFHGTPLKSGTHTTGADITSITLPGDAVNGVLLVWITSQP